MKIYLYIFFLICLTVAIGCNYSKSYLSNNTKECSIVSKDTSFEKHIFPIIETKYRTSDIIKYFKRGVKIDSGFNKNSNGDTVLFYKYYDDSSQFIFSLNDYSKKMYNFDIAVFRLNSDLINLKNGIKPGMNRKVFFNIIKLKEADCDTFDVHENFKGYYFRFIFNNKILKSISKEYIQL